MKFLVLFLCFLIGAETLAPGTRGFLTRVERTVVQKLHTQGDVGRISQALFASFMGDDGEDDEADEELERLVDNLPSKRMRSGGKPKAKPKKIPLKPEFSRILNVGSIPEKRSVLCKLLAKPSEREGLALRFDLPELTHFAANVTVRRQDPYSILIAGTIDAQITASSTLLPPQDICGSFETLVLDSVSLGGASSEAISLSEATDYDEEVASNGDIDIGEICSQYFSLELFS